MSVETTLESQDFFEKHVRPLLATSCVACHGPDEQSGGLRVDSRMALLAGGNSGPAIDLQNLSASLLLKAVRREGNLQMPPDNPLHAQEVAILEAWILQGAPWNSSEIAARQPADAATEHWAFQPIGNPPVPSMTALATENEIDAFINQQLELQQLTPAPPADRRTLMRRLSIDLLGLLPTDAEMQAFVADRRPDAYARLVDRYLASPHYGEQAARRWLDVARYADTKGYVYAREERAWVHAWAYRDWLIQAFNDDLPYDQFLQLQLAADQISPHDRRHWPAMGFLTIGRRFLGVIHDIIDDRIDVVTRGTMGLTVACARCHDHKYDPIPTSDYYALYGVFRSCEERLVPVSEPRGNSVEVSAFQVGLIERQKKFDQAMADVRVTVAQRVRDRVHDYLQAQFELDKYPRDGFEQILLEGDILPNFVRQWQDYLSRRTAVRDPIFLAWQKYAALSDAEWNRERVAQVHQELSALPQHPLVAACFASPPQSRADLVQRYAQLFARIDQQGQANRPETTALDSPTIKHDELESIRQVLYGPESPCEIPQEPIVHVERFMPTATCEKLWKLQGDIDRYINDSPVVQRYSLILADREYATEPQVFLRGNPLRRGESVPRRFLQLFNPEKQAFQHGSGRLELAQAIANRQNPLTARVIVNRLWQSHFGRGLVESASDFGLRSPPPTHPQLLDWLATRLIESNWSLKTLQRKMVLSAAYQRDSQSSIYPQHSTDWGQAMQVDPSNRWLWHMPARRLSWEELRDNLLQVTGELCHQFGGRPTDLLATSFRRRTLYARVDRQFLPATLRTFDFASPDLHIPQRKETTVPQQALFFLNDPLVVARAKSLAQRVTQDHDDPRERIQELYRRTFQRAATDQEVSEAQHFLRDASRETSDNGASPESLLPWEQLSQVLLSSNEFMFID